MQQQAPARHASKFLLPEVPLTTKQTRKQKQQQAAAVQQIIAAATPEVREVAAAALAAQMSAFGAPPRPREANPADQRQQVKAQRIDDGMEQSLVVCEAPGQSSAPMQPAMQISQSTVTIGSVVTAADEGVDQPSQQTLALAVAPFSFEEDKSNEGGTAASPDTQIKAALADCRQVVQACDQQIQRALQQKAEALLMQQQLEAALTAHAAPAEPMQVSPTQAPKQKQPPQPSAEQPRPQAPKQPQQQPAKPPAQQPAHLCADVLTAGYSAMVRAMLPPAMQTQPQWQQQPQQRQAQRRQQQPPQAPKQTQQQPKQRPSTAVGVDRFPHLLHFTLSGKGVDTRGSAAEVVCRAVAQLDGGAGVVVVDAVRHGPAADPRFQFKVATHEQADTLVRGRGKAFAGSGIVLSEVLSTAETARHKQLYPDFLRLQAAGHRVQFRRARLFVDGQLWSKTGGPAAA